MKGEEAQTCLKESVFFFFFSYVSFKVQSKNHTGPCQCHPTPPRAASNLAFGVRRDELIAPHRALDYPPIMHPNVLVLVVMLLLLVQGGRENTASAATASSDVNTKEGAKRSNVRIVRCACATRPGWGGPRPAGTLHCLRPD